jgi:hypothetical protein
VVFMHCSGVLHTNLIIPDEVTACGHGVGADWVSQLHTNANKWEAHTRAELGTEELHRRKRRLWVTHDWQCCEAFTHMLQVSDVASFRKVPLFKIASHCVRAAAGGSSSRLDGPHNGHQTSARDMSSVG